MIRKPFHDLTQDGQAFRRMIVRSLHVLADACSSIGHYDSAGVLLDAAEKIDTEIQSQHDALSTILNTEFTIPR